MHLLTLGLIIAMTVTLFITQLQLMRKNMPMEALEGPFAQQQKIMLYVFPLIFAVGGINFPVGVLIYWFTSNLWTMGQQFYVIRRNPAPGTPAFAAWEERRQRHESHRHTAEPVAETGRVAWPWRRRTAAPRPPRARRASYASSRASSPGPSAGPDPEPPDPVRRVTRPSGAGPSGAAP